MNTFLNKLGIYFVESYVPKLVKEIYGLKIHHGLVFNSSSVPCLCRKRVHISTTMCVLTFDAPPSSQMRKWGRVPYKLIIKSCNLSMHDGAHMYVLYWSLPPAASSLQEPPAYILWSNFLLDWQTNFTCSNLIRL